MDDELENAKLAFLTAFRALARAGGMVWNKEHDAPIRQAIVAIVEAARRNEPLTSETKADITAEARGKNPK